MSYVSFMFLGMGIQAFMASVMIYSGMGTPRQQATAGLIFLVIAFITRKKKHHTPI